ncbi:unnamed protein product [Urochloa humidicola]
MPPATARKARSPLPPRLLHRVLLVECGGLLRGSPHPPHITPAPPAPSPMTSPKIRPPPEEQDPEVADAAVVGDGATCANGGEDD